MKQLGLPAGGGTVRGGKPHRPRLRRRFLRNRFADPTGFGERRLEDWLEEHFYAPPMDQFGDSCFWNFWADCYEDADPTLVAKHFEIRQFLRNIRWDVGKGLLDSLPRFQTHSELHQSDEPWWPIEERLMLHVKALFYHPEDSSALRDAFDNSPFCVTDGDFIEQGKKEGDFRDMVAAFLPFWIRSPRTCENPSDRAAILAHVFAKDLDEMPRFVRAFDHCGWSDLKWFVWLIIVGYRGSLQRASEAFSWRIAKKFQFALETIDPTRLPGTEVPSVSLLQQTTLLAEVTRLGGNSVDARRLLQHPAYAIDPSDLSVDDGLLVFWAETVRWIAAHRSEMCDDNCWPILDWAMHEFIERSRQGDERAMFRWNGRTVAAATQAAAHYQARIAARDEAAKSWPSRNLSWMCETEEDPPDATFDGNLPSNGVTKWRFVELTSGKLLSEEGEELRHCVGSYWRYCADKVSAIVSLRRNGQRRVTIEIDPSTLQIRQMRGYCNREATPQERTIIRRWQREWVTLHAVRSDARQGNRLTNCR